MLVALAIFGLIAVMAYSGLSAVLNQQAQTEAAADRLSEIQKTYLIMQRDIEQLRGLVALQKNDLDDKDQAIVDFQNEHLAKIIRHLNP